MALNPAEQQYVVPNPEQQPTMDVEEVARAYGISRATAYEWVRDGLIPSIRGGRRIRVPTAVVRRQLGLDEHPQPA